MFRAGSLAARWLLLFFLVFQEVPPLFRRATPADLTNAVARILAGRFHTPPGVVCASAHTYKEPKSARRALSHWPRAM